MKINKRHIGVGPSNVEDLKQSISILSSLAEHQEQTLKQQEQTLKGLQKKKRKLKDELKRLKGIKKQGISSKKRKKMGDGN